MPTDTTVNNLVINKLTKAQYDAIQNPSDTEIYLVPDAIDTTPTSGSDNLVTSGGVYNALNAKVSSTGGNVTVNNIQVVSSLPPSPDNNTLYLVTGS